MGRPPGRIQHRLFQMRASDEFLRSVDRWRLKQSDQPSRAEAIRRLVEQALGSKSPPRTSNKHGARKASKLASHALEGLGDKSAPADELARRKRKLIHGPKEFRDIRSDQPKKEGAHGR